MPPDEVLGLARAVRSGVLVVNPASGPGAEAPRRLPGAVRGGAREGTRVLGYVPTAYGARDAAAVEADIDRYASWYGTDGIFLDEAASGADALPYYRALAAHVRAAGERLVVLNPGVVPDRRYFGVADVVVTFEGRLRVVRGAASATRLARGRAGGPDRPARLRRVGRRRAPRSGRRPRAGHVYATPGRLPHPWGTVPDDARPALRASPAAAPLTGRPVLRRLRAGPRPRHDFRTSDPAPRRASVAA